MRSKYARLGYKGTRTEPYADTSPNARNCPRIKGVCNNDLEARHRLSTTLGKSFFTDSRQGDFIPSFVIRDGFPYHNEPTFVDFLYLRTLKCFSVYTGLLYKFSFGVDRAFSFPVAIVPRRLNFL